MAKIESAARKAYFETMAAALKTYARERVKIAEAFREAMAQTEVDYAETMAKAWKICEEAEAEYEESK